MDLPPHFLKQSKKTTARQESRPPATFFFGPPGAGKSFRAMQSSRKNGGSILIVVPTIALRKRAESDGLNSMTVQHALCSGTLKYRVKNNVPKKQQAWKTPRNIIFGEIFQWSKLAMDECCKLLGDLPSDVHVIMEGDPYQHGAVCQNRSPTDEFAVMKQSSKQKYCSYKKCYCKPVLESEPLNKLMKEGDVTFLRANYRLTNLYSISIIDEVLKIGNPKEGRSEAFGAIEHMIERKFIPLRKVPRSPDIVRVTYSHEAIKFHTELFYKENLVSDYDKETCLCIGGSATVTVTRRNKKGDYLWYNGMQVTVTGFSKDFVLVTSDETIDDDEAIVAELLEEKGNDMKELKIPRKLPGVKRTIIPNYIKTSYAVQGDTLNNKLVVVYLDGHIPLDALYVMTTRGNDTVFTSTNLKGFFRQLASNMKMYDTGMLRKFWSLCKE